VADAGLRDILIHAYSRVDLDIIWDVVATNCLSSRLESGRSWTRAAASAGTVTPGLESVQGAGRRWVLCDDSGDAPVLVEAGERQ
jgi:hypothetical protein